MHVLFGQTQPKRSSCPSRPPFGAEWRRWNEKWGWDWVFPFFPCVMLGWDAEQSVVGKTLPYAVNGLEINSSLISAYAAPPTYIHIRCAQQIVSLYTAADATTLSEHTHKQSFGCVRCGHCGWSKNACRRRSRRRC